MQNFAWQEPRIEVDPEGGHIPQGPKEGFGEGQGDPHRWATNSFQGDLFMKELSGGEGNV